MRNCEINLRASRKQFDEHPALRGSFFSFPMRLQRLLSPICANLIRSPRLFEQVQRNVVYLNVLA